MIELGSYLAGPLLGKHLVNFGLRVTCVRRPMHARGAAAEEERMRAMRASLDAGKEVLTLDLRENEADRARLAALLRSASVLVENFGAGVMERLKLTPTECWAINPSLLYVSLPGYASGDAEFAHLKAWDSVLMASAGVFRDMGLNRTLLGVRASFSGLPMPSVYASVFESIMEPERLIHFRVPWVDDRGVSRVNRGAKTRQWNYITSWFLPNK